MHDIIIPCAFLIFHLKLVISSLKLGYWISVETTSKRDNVVNIVLDNVDFKPSPHWHFISSYHGKASCSAATNDLMASKSHFYLNTLFILLLSIFCLKSSSSSLSDTETDYIRWVSWNVHQHQERAMLRAKSTIQAPGADGKLVLDDKLRQAEMNSVRVNVSQDGTGDFKTIGDAINSIPPYNTRRVIIAIKPGVYREKIFIPRTLPFLTFLGDWSEPPTITGNDTASVSGNDGKSLRTYQSATVAVDANYFVAINMKFENTAPHVIGTRQGQAVALRISGTKAAFYNCSFYGDQDTLYDHKGLHYFNNCFIQGSVDFIFGSGRSFYENCHLNSIAKKVASLTAQKRSNSSLSSGFSFKDSTITGSGLIYLGRAWGDYSRVVFSYTYMDKIVLPQGWNDWGDQRRDSRVYYGEYKCTGPGSNLTGRVTWARVLTDEEARPFIGTYYVEGETWLIGP